MELRNQFFMFSLLICELLVRYCCQPAASSVRRGAWAFQAETCSFSAQFLEMRVLINWRWGEKGTRSGETPFVCMTRLSPPDLVPLRVEPGHLLEVGYFQEVSG
jgi:hypothetical protein